MNEIGKYNEGIIMLSKKKILFTGMSSYIGKNLMPLLSQLKDYEIVCYSRKQISGIKTIIGDISEREKIKKAMNGVDIIVHMASETTDKEKLFTTNVVGTQNIVDMAKEQGISKFIYLSSISVTHYLGTPYPDSKKAAEEIIQQNLKKYIIIRPTEIYGGIDSKKYMVHINKIKNSRIFITSRGDHYIQPVYVGDVAKAIIKSIKSDRMHGIFISAGDKPELKSEIYRMIRNKYNPKCILIFLPDWIAFLIRPIIGRKESWKDYKAGMIDRRYERDFKAIGFKEGLEYVKC